MVECLGFGFALLLQMGQMGLYFCLFPMLPVFAANFNLATVDDRANHTAFRGHLENKCASLDHAAGTCSGVTQDCVLMPSYYCDGSFSSTVQTDGYGVTTLTFSATVSSPADKSSSSGNTNSCTRYKTCVGPAVHTDTRTLQTGDCIVWEFSAETGGDDYEVWSSAEEISKLSASS